MDLHSSITETCREVNNTWTKSELGQVNRSVLIYIHCQSGQMYSVWFSMLSEFIEMCLVASNSRVSVLKEWTHATPSHAAISFNASAHRVEHC